MVEAVKERIVFMNGSKLLERWVNGKWKVITIEAAPGTQPGIYPVKSGQ